MRILCVFGAVLVAALPCAALGNQTIPLTTKLTQLEGRWTRDPARGLGDICGVPVADWLRISVTASEVAINGSVFSGAIKLDGTISSLSDSRAATAALDAGWLAITMRRERNDGFTNVMREVYIVKDNVLTVWRTLNVELPDGTQGKIDCGNHQAIVFVKQV